MAPKGLIKKNGAAGAGENWGPLKSENDLEGVNFFFENDPEPGGPLRVGRGPLRARDPPPLRVKDPWVQTDFEKKVDPLQIVFTFEGTPVLPRAGGSVFLPLFFFCFFFIPF